jgi:hypothetical protein
VIGPVPGTHRQLSADEAKWRKAQKAHETRLTSYSLMDTKTPDTTALTRVNQSPTRTGLIVNPGHGYGYDTNTKTKRKVSNAKKSSISIDDHNDTKVATNKISSKKPKHQMKKVIIEKQQRKKDINKAHSHHRHYNDAHSTRHDHYHGDANDTTSDQDTDDNDGQGSDGSDNSALQYPHRRQQSTSSLRGRHAHLQQKDADSHHDDDDDDDDHDEVKHDKTDDGGNKRRDGFRNSHDDNGRCLPISFDQLTTIQLAGFGMYVIHCS